MKLSTKVKHKMQRKERGFSDEDCWDLYGWLGETFPKMIKNLADMKHGYPELKFEEVENMPLSWVSEAAYEIRKSKVEGGYEDEFDISDGFDRWQLILRRMAWCLEQTNEDVVKIENPYQEQFSEAVLSKKEIDSDLRKKYLDKEREIFKHRDNCKNEAFDLIKEYFWNLWD